MNLSKSFLTTAGLLLISAAPSWAVITVSGNNAGGAGYVITTSSGVTLPTGSRIRIGFFNDPAGNAAILSGNDFNAINNIFHPLGEGTGADGSGTPNAGVGTGQMTLGANGRFNIQVQGITQAYLPQGSPLYFWILGNQAVGPAPEWAIFTNNDANAGGSPWVAPFDDPQLGGSTTLAVTTARIDDANDLTRGATQLAPNQLRLAAIPEPGSLALLSLLGLGILARRRR